MILQPGNLFHDRYLLLEMKGRGSFGEVWHAQDTKLDIDVAIKVYIALDLRGVEEFKSEYKTAFRLNHPNVLHANYFDICENRPYLVMPYCPNSVVNLIGQIDESTIWHFIFDVASGLDYLHSMGVIHHDIKPDNIMMDSNGLFLITDFGISVKFRSTLRRNSERQVSAETKGGSIPYMAPEMFSETPEAVNASDIWALGATIYELLSGELPFFGQGGAMQLNGAMPPELSGDWSNELKQVVKKCLCSQPWDRPTAKRLASFAQAVLDGKKPVFEDKNKKKGILFYFLLVSSLAFVVGGAFLCSRYIIEDTPSTGGEEPVVQQEIRSHVFELPSGESYSYEGDFDSLGIPNGHGIAVFESYKYEGSFENGMMEGYGELEYTKGDLKGRRYRGYFCENQIDSGMLESGSIKFTGCFKDMEYWNGVMSNEDGECFNIVDGNIVVE